MVWGSPSHNPGISTRSVPSGTLRPREREILVGDAPRAVCRQLDNDAPPGHREIGMVVRRLRAEADRVDEHERRRPPIGLVYAADPSVLVVPTGKLLEPLGDL